AWGGARVLRGARALQTHIATVQKLLWASICSQETRFAEWTFDSSNCRIDLVVGELDASIVAALLLSSRNLHP
ncbi:unnamed protein product, partial [Urochloa humidicola]